MTKNITFILSLMFAFFIAPAANITVNTQGMTFNPSSININVGDTVTWNNTGGFHNVNGTILTYPNNPEGFGNNLGSGWTFTHIFTIPGTYNYQCDPHLPGMIGVVNVSQSNSVYDVVANSSDHTTLKTAIDACSLDGTLSGSGPFTLFAPTDAAFNLLPAGTVTALLNDIPQLTDILLHHVVGGSVMSTMLSNNQVVTTLLGTDVTVTINSNGVYIDNAMVTVADIIADNGVVHVIDAVLLPPVDCNGITNGTALVDTCGTCHQAYIYNFITHQVVFVDNANILVPGVDYDPTTEIVVMPNDPSSPYWNACTNSVYDIVANSSDHTTLKTAIDACSLDGTLSGSGPFTLFAPTDAAFNLLPAGTVTALLNDIPQLTDILLHHVVGDSVMSTMLSNNQVVTTLLGTDVTVTINSNGVYIDNAMVTVADIIADNGVVHVIDAVLLPPTPSNILNLSNTNKPNYMYTINILGKKVNKNLNNQILFDVYDNGQIIKIIKKL